MRESKMNLAVLLTVASFCALSKSSVEERALLIQLDGEEKELNARDMLNTRLSSIGTHPDSGDGLIFYSSITTNEECVLKKVKSSSPIEERCENLSREVCKKG